MTQILKILHMQRKSWNFSFKHTYFIRIIKIVGGSPQQMKFIWNKARIAFPLLIISSLCKLRKTSKRTTHVMRKNKKRQKREFRLTFIICIPSTLSLRLYILRRSDAYRCMFSMCIYRIKTAWMTSIFFRIGNVLHESNIMVKSQMYYIEYVWNDDAEVVWQIN